MMIFDDDDEDFSYEEEEEVVEPEPLDEENLPLEEEPPPVQDTWICSCGQENVGDFCVSCGSPKIQEPSTPVQDTWICSCGQENVGDFCVSCGSPKIQESSPPAQDTWICSCGQENVGDFCVSCGKRKNQNSNKEIKEKLNELADKIDEQRRRSRQNNQSISVNENPPQENFNETQPPQSPIPPLPPPINNEPLPAENNSNKNIIIGALAGLLLLGGGFFAYQHFNEKPGDINNVAPVAQENMRITATYYVVNCNQSVTLRRTPSTAAQELAQVPLGKAVGFIEDTDNGFCKVNYDGATGYILAQYLSQEKPAQSIPQQAPPANNPSTANNSSTLSLGGIHLGDSLQQMQSILGREDRTTQSKIDGSQFNAEYRNIVVTHNGRRVVGLVSYSPAVKTELNLHEGSTLNDVIAAYGRRCSVQNIDGSTLYEYPYDTGKGSLAVMRFAVKNGVVDYISLRYVSDPKEKQDILSLVKTL